MFLAPLRSTDLSKLFAWINDHDLVVLSAPFRRIAEREHREWFDDVTVRSDVVIRGVRLLETDELIGSCQLKSIDRRTGTAELQIRIGSASHRDVGLGTEAVRLLVDLAFRELELHRVCLHVFADNSRAIRSYEKSGFVREGVLREAALIDGRRKDVIVMGILRSERALAGR